MEKAEIDTPFHRHSFCRVLGPTKMGGPDLSWHQLLLLDDSDFATTTRIFFAHDRGRVCFEKIAGYRWAIKRGDLRFRGLELKGNLFSVLNTYLSMYLNN